MLEEPIKYLVQTKSQENYERMLNELGEVDSGEFEIAKEFVNHLPLIHTTNFCNTGQMFKEGVLCEREVKKRYPKLQTLTFEIDKKFGLDGYVFCSPKPLFVGVGSVFLVLNPSLLNRDDILVTENDIMSMDFILDDYIPEHLKQYGKVFCAQPKANKTSNDIFEKERDALEKKYGQPFSNFIYGISSWKDISEEQFLNLIKPLGIKIYSEQLLTGPQFKEYLARKIAKKGTKSFINNYFAGEHELNFEIKIPEQVPPQNILGAIVDEYYLETVIDFGIPKEKCFPVMKDIDKYSEITKLLRERKKIISETSQEEDYSDINLEELVRKQIIGTDEFEKMISNLETKKRYRKELKKAVKNEILSNIISKHLPQSMEEILEPERYLQRIGGNSGETN